MKQDKLRSEMSTVRGLGAAHDGTHHYIVQRVTAIALVPLVLWFVYSVICQIGADYASFTAWLGSLHVATLMVLLIIATFWHAALGLQTVVEDYVHCHAMKIASLLAIKLGCFALAVAGILSVLKIAFQA